MQLSFWVFWTFFEPSILLVSSDGFTIYLKSLERNHESSIYQVILYALFGMVSLRDLLERLSDLQLGDKKVTLNHLVY